MSPLSKRMRGLLSRESKGKCALPALDLHAEGHLTAYLVLPITPSEPRNARTNGRRNISNLDSSLQSPPLFYNSQSRRIEFVPELRMFPVLLSATMFSSLSTLAKPHCRFINPSYMRSINVSAASYRASNPCKGKIARENASRCDPQGQAMEGGFKAHTNSEANVETPLDAATHSHKPKPEPLESGNPENIGFVEQVGSQSVTARKYEDEDKAEKERT
ncbi:hypothetical protein AMATHDRAFT_8537 [Amanita thiersii Skay4041]|uniref:Uncharacterized protein n=1 Tax=Amanita thiersii Skay4041 TaxID=703135 RepID=A0A2A9NDL9_9AGAR|nr:hypothetical protein AMATHDRAFT_8537 [Amanita thiersii Skay4041]